MNHKTADLTGALLDAAVAKAQGLEFEIHEQKVWGDGSGITIVHAEPACFSAAGYYEPSSDWRAGGPIIEAHSISVIKDKDDGLWYAGPEYWIQGGFDGEYATGPTPLIAAMRAFVAAKLGPEVDL